VFDYLVGNALLRSCFGPVYDTDAFRTRLGQFALVLLSLIAMGAGYFIGNRVKDDIGKLATEGVIAQGTIVDKTFGWNRNNAEYNFRVEFATPDGVRHSKSLMIDPTEYNSKGIGSPISVRYVRSKPDTFYLVGREPQGAEVIALNYLFYGGVAGLAMSFLIFAIWGGGKVDGEMPAPVTRTTRPAALITSARTDITASRRSFGRRK
jgi:hypothetical protein